MPKKLMKRVKKFLQQKEDYIWLTSQRNAPTDRNDCRKPFAMEPSSSVPGSYNFRETRGNNGKTTEPFSGGPGSYNFRETRGNNGKTTEPFSGGPGAYDVQEPQRNDVGKQVAPRYDRQASNRGNFPAEQHSCEERVVYTTFPNDLSKYDFEKYIDRKFSNLDVTIRDEIKCLRNVNQETDMGNNVYVIDEPDGSTTATLIQMLYENNADSNEIDISVGYIKYTTKSQQCRDQLWHDWQINRDRIERALQYKFGLQLERELD